MRTREEETMVDEPRVITQGKSHLEHAHKVCC